MNDKFTIVETADGCDTVFNSEIGEHYHSINGSYEESMHVFINNGLLKSIKNQVNIFEVGFGTGLNAILTFIESQKNNLKVNYFAIEKYPLDQKITDEINFSKFLNSDELEIFKKVHIADWNQSVKISDNFLIHKISNDLIEFQPFFDIDITYFDAFSFDKQPEMWSLDVFGKIYEATNSGGFLTTYASKGIIKQNLREVGFFVKRLPGINGKRHIVRAEKS